MAHIWVWLQIGVILYLGVVQAANKKYVDQRVEIEVLYEPPDCKYRSKEKDFLTTEYIGKFLNGEKFDST